MLCAQEDAEKIAEAIALGVAVALGSELSVVSQDKVPGACTRSHGGRGVLVWQGAGRDGNLSAGQARSLSSMRYYGTCYGREPRECTPARLSVLRLAG